MHLRRIHSDLFARTNQRSFLSCGLICLVFHFCLIGASQTASAEEAIKPTDSVIKLFNGKDLSGLFTFLKDTKYEDPRKVFTVKDGLLHISGDGLGAVLTKKEYRDYHLICDFRWGPRTWHHRKDRTKDSGVLVHCKGPDDGYGGIWPTSIEAQIIQGGVGDFIVVRGKDENGEPAEVSLTAKVSPDRDGEMVWDKNGEEKVFTGGRINWFGRDPDWADTLDFRGKQDVESQGEEWTRLEVICDGDRITNIVNGVIVNEGYNAIPQEGKILIQTEMAELYVRRWELWPLGKAPKYQKPE